MTDRRGSVFVDPLPDNRPPPTPVPAPVASSDILGAHWTLGRQDMAGAELQSQIDAYGPIVTELMKREKPGAFGLNWYDPYTTQARSGMPYSTGRIWAKVQEIRQQEPGFMKDIPASNEAQFNAFVAKQEADRRHAAQDVSQRQQGLAQNTLGFTTDVGTGLLDPTNVGAMILSGGTAAPAEGAIRSTASTMARLMLKESAVNTATEVASLPSIAANRKRFGEDMTAGEMAQDVVTAGVTGALFPVVTHAGGAGVKAVASAVADGPIGRAAARVTAPLALAASPVGRASDADVARQFAQAVPAEIRTPDERAALHVIERQSDVAATNPFVPTPAGMDAHADRLDAATADILTRGDPNGGVAVPKPLPRRAVAATPVDTPDARATFMQHVGRAENATGNPNAKNPLSSATGKYQFTDRTWLQYYKREIGAGGQSDAQILAQRSNNGLQDRLMTSLTADNAAHLHSIGAPETAGNLYLEHFAGQKGAEHILTADPHAPIEGVLSREAIEANPFLKGKTAGDVIEWAHAKMGEKVHNGPVLARDNFDSNEEWSAAQREVDLADAAEQAARAADDRATAERAAAASGMAAASDPAISPSADPKGFDLMPADEPVRAHQDFYNSELDRYGPNNPSAPIDEQHALTPRGDDTFYRLHTLSKDDLEELVRTAPREAEVDDGVTTREQAQEVLREHQDFSQASTDHLIDRVRGTLIDERQRDWIQRVKEGRADTQQQASFVRLGGLMAELGRRGELGNLDEKLVRSLIEHGYGPHDAREIMHDRLANLEAASRRSLPEPSPHEAPIEADRHAPAFDHPTDKAPMAQIESISHDLRIAAEANPDQLFRVGDGETERPLSEILADLDAEDAAIAAVKACL